MLQPGFLSLKDIRAWIHVPEGQLANESKLRLKRGRPIDSKDVPLQKRRTQMSIGTPKEVHDKKIIIVKAN